MGVSNGNSHGLFIPSFPRKHDDFAITERHDPEESIFYQEDWSRHMGNCAASGLYPNHQYKPPVIKWYMDVSHNN